MTYYDIGLYECLASNNPYNTGALSATDKQSLKVTVVGEEVHSIIKQFFNIMQYSVLCIWLIIELPFFSSLSTVICEGIITYSSS